MKCLCRVCRRVSSCRTHWARTWLRWLRQFAIPVVRPPTAAPVRAASAEMMEASTGAISERLRKSAVTVIGRGFGYDADDRGPSEISRELRCPDRYDQSHCVWTRNLFLSYGSASTCSAAHI